MEQNNQTPWPSYNNVGRSKWNLNDTVSAYFIPGRYVEKALLVVRRVVSRDGVQPFYDTANFIPHYFQVVGPPNNGEGGTFCSNDFRLMGRLD